MIFSVKFSFRSCTRSNFSLSLFRQLSYSTILPATSSINMSVKSTLIEVVLFMTSIDSGLDSLSEEEKVAWLVQVTPPQLWLGTADHTQSQGKGRRGFCLQWNTREEWMEKGWMGREVVVYTGEQNAHLVYLFTVLVEMKSLRHSLGVGDEQDVFFTA